MSKGGTYPCRVRALLALTTRGSANKLDFLPFWSNWSQEPITCFMVDPEARWGGCVWQPGSTNHIEEDAPPPLGLERCAQGERDDRATERDLIEPGRARKRERDRERQREVQRFMPETFRGTATRAARTPPRLEETHSL